MRLLISAIFALGLISPPAMSQERPLKPRKLMPVKPNDRARRGLLRRAEIGKYRGGHDQSNHPDRPLKPLFESYRQFLTERGDQHTQTATELKKAAIQAKKNADNAHASLVVTDPRSVQKYVNALRVQEIALKLDERFGKSVDRLKHDRDMLKSLLKDNVDTVGKFLDRSKLRRSTLATEVSHLEEALAGAEKRAKETSAATTREGAPAQTKLVEIKKHLAAKKKELEKFDADTASLTRLAEVISNTCENCAVDPKRMALIYGELEVREIMFDTLEGEIRQAETNSLGVPFPYGGGSSGGLGIPYGQFGFPPKDPRLNGRDSIRDPFFQLPDNHLPPIPIPNSGRKGAEFWNKDPGIRIDPNKIRKMDDDIVISGQVIRAD